MRSLIKRFAPIRFHWSVIALFVLIPVLTFFTHGLDRGVIEYRLTVAAILYASFILHELSHLLVGLLSGHRTFRIRIYALTTSSVMLRRVSCLRTQLQICFAGPTANMLIALSALALSLLDFPFSHEIFYINAALCLYNLLPVYPLDGGRILKTLIAHYTKNPQWASIVTLRVSAFISLTAAVVGIITLSPTIFCASLVMSSGVWSSYTRHVRVWNRFERF